MVIHLVLMKVHHFDGNSTTDMLSVELFGTSSVFLTTMDGCATLSRVLRELKLG